MVRVADDILIDEIRDGSERHFKLLFDYYWSRLYTIANRTLDRSEDAEDVVQEIFIDIWKRSESLKVDNVGGYLYTCVRFGIAKKLKKNISRKTEEIFENIRDHSDMAHSLELQDLVQFVEGKIDQFPSRCKEIFKLSRFEQLSNKEIAKKLNITTSTVENQINKALKLLKADDQLSNEITFLVILLILSIG